MFWKIGFVQIVLFSFQRFYELFNKILLSTTSDFINQTGLKDIIWAGFSMLYLLWLFLDPLWSLQDIQ